MNLTYAAEKLKELYPGSTKHTIIAHQSPKKGKVKIIIRWVSDDNCNDGLDFEISNQVLAKENDLDGFINRLVTEKKSRDRIKPNWA